MIRLSLGIAAAAATIVAPFGVFAMEPYEALQKEATTFAPVLETSVTDVHGDVEEMAREGTAEFFPVDGSQSSSARSIDPALEKFVIVRVNGAPYPLKDVPSSAWFAPYVRDMAERGIVSGYRDANGIPTGVFAPASPVLREELAKMAVEAAGIPAVTCGEPKNPLAKDRWSASHIACAESHGFAVYADGTVDIAAHATRAEVVMTILQAFGIALKDVPETSPFRDVSSSTLYSPAIFTAYDAGIVSGYADASGNPTGEFKPDAPVNRAEVAKMLSIALQLYQE